MSSKSVAARPDVEGKMIACRLATRGLHGGVPLTLVGHFTQRDRAHPATAMKPGLY